METPTLTTMVVLYTTGVRLDTNVLVEQLPINEIIIKIEKQGILRRGESKKDKIKRRVKAVVVKKPTGFGHNSITMVLMSSGDGLRTNKEITVKIFQNGVFHITGVLHESYDRHVVKYIHDTVQSSCPQAIVSGTWNLETRRVVLMNYKTKLIGVSNLSRESLYLDVRKQGLKTNYDPDVYPAVKIHFPDKKWIAKVFRTGNIILTGMTSEDECLELKNSLERVIVSVSQ